MPELYYGTQPASMVQADAARAQQAALAQQQMASQNYAADRQFWGTVNTVLGNKEISAANNSAELERLLASLGLQRDVAGMQNDTQRYGIDAQKYGIDTNAAANRYATDAGLAGQMAGYDTQRQIAEMNAMLNRYTADTNSQTSLGVAGIGAQSQLQQAQLAAQANMLPAQLQQQRFESVLPMLSSLFSQYGVQMPQGIPGGSQQAPQTQGMAGQPAGAAPPAAMPAGASAGDTGYPSGLHGYAPAPMPTHGMYLPGTGPTPEPSAAGVPGAPIGSATPATGGIGGVLGNYGAAGTDGASLGGSGLPSVAPAVGMGDVITPQMQSQMLNNTYAQTAAQYAATQNQANRAFANRGLNPRGPGAQYNQVLNQAGQNQANQNTQAAYQIPMNAAKTNADYRIGAAGANTANQNSFWNAYGAQQANKTNQMGSMLNALTGFSR